MLSEAALATGDAAGHESFPVEGETSSNSCLMGSGEKRQNERKYRALCATSALRAPPRGARKLPCSPNERDAMRWAASP